MNFSVRNRKGILIPLDVGQVQSRIKNIADGRLGHIELNSLDYDFSRVCVETLAKIVDKISTYELDKISARIAYDLILENPVKYNKFASRMEINNYEKHSHNILCQYFKESEMELTKNNMYWTYRMLYENLDSHNNQAPRISPVLMKIISRDKDKINQIINYKREYFYSYRAYIVNQELFFMKSRVPSGEYQVEKVQHCYMRIAICMTLGGEYIDHYLLRTNWKQFRIDISDIWDKYCSSQMVWQIGGKSKLEYNELNYERLIQYIYSKNDDRNSAIDAVNKIRELYDKNTLSWNDYMESLDVPELNWDEVKFIYDKLSMIEYTHATPTIFNIGTLQPQCSSCYVNGLPVDSVDGILELYNKKSALSKHAGGVGNPLYSIRPSSSIINSTGKQANGISHVAKILDILSININQAGKREGSEQETLSPLHPEFLTILRNRHPKSSSMYHLESITTAAWIPDIFMKAVKKEAITRIPNWRYVDPCIHPEFYYMFGDELERAYEQYHGSEPVSAMQIFQDLIQLIHDLAIPYMLFSDNFNRLNPQRMLIPCSNLCCEIALHCNFSETAVCNLASICLGNMISDKPMLADCCNEKHAKGYETNILKLLGQPNARSRMKYINWIELDTIVRLIVRSLDKIIDMNFYPIPEAKYSNQMNRPQGIGVQDYHGLLMRLLLPYNSEEARELNFRLFEFIYFTALDESCKLSIELGEFKRFGVSAYKDGILQFDMLKRKLRYPLSLDWDSLQSKIKKHGIRNSDLIALMPTATTADKTETHIEGKTYGIEPISGHIIKRKSKSGEMLVINYTLVEVLQELGIEFHRVVDRIMENRYGGISDLDLPDLVKNIFRTAWELTLDEQLDAFLDRAPFIDQSSSNNIFIADYDATKLAAYYFRAWENELKTGSYYTRCLHPVNAKKFGQVIASNTVKSENTVVKSEVCEIIDGRATCCE